DPARHIKLAMHDIVEQEFDMVPPARQDAERIIEVALSWDRAAPLLVHCWAGVSRSGAAALMTLAALNPGREQEAAQLMRARSSWAMPNPLMIEHADDLLNCSGRLIGAANGMSPANLAAQGEPYRLPAILD
ncbi:MAG: tyrosine phosphatase family protein, partial [Alphaproteobacteria bacterium]